MGPKSSTGFGSTGQYSNCTKWWCPPFAFQKDRLSTIYLIWMSGYKMEQLWLHGLALCDVKTDFPFSHDLATTHLLLESISWFQPHFHPSIKLMFPIKSLDWCQPKHRAITESHCVNAFRAFESRFSPTSFAVHMFCFHIWFDCWITMNLVFSNFY